MVRRLFRQVRRGLGGGGVILVQRAAQIPFGFAAFFGEQDRRQQPPAQQPADQRHDPRAEAGLERRKPGPRAAQHLFPARDMLFFHARQVREDFGPLGVGLRRGDASIEEGGVALVSPVLQPQLSLRRRAIALHVFCLNSKWTGRALPVYNDFGRRVPPAWPYAWAGSEAWLNAADCRSAGLNGPR